MKYYEIIVDQRERYRYRIERITWEKDKEKAFGVGYITGEADEFPDFILYQKKILVSRSLKQVIEMYSTSVQFSLVVLNNLTLQYQKEYYLLEAPYIDALSEQTTYLKNGWIDKLCLSAKKIEDYEVFYLEDKQANAYTPMHLYMNLDVVEGILRRELWGMQFESVRVEEVW